MAKLTAVVVALAAGVVSAYDNGLGATPPMGWNTWCTDDLCGVLDRCTEAEVKSIADAMASNGMQDLGYDYILLDDCWAAQERDADGRLAGNAKQFPSGMKAMADYVHSLGFKFGLYTCVGTYTCKQHRPGSYGHFDIDAQTFADWGIDFVKADYCYHPDNETAVDQYTALSQALNATGRHMLFSTCEWGEEEVWSWGGDVAQMFRVQADHLPFWRFPQDAAGQGFGQGTKEIIEWMAHLQPSQWTAPYSWMDPDFLMTLFLENETIGDYTPMTFIESRTEFSFWSLWSSPLILATDPRDMSEAKKSIILNKEVIDIDQDPLFRGGDRIYNSETGAQIWSKPLANGDIAVILYNSGNVATLPIKVTWEMLGWDKTASVTLRDLWAHEEVSANLPGGFAAKIGPRDVRMLRLSQSA